MAHHFAARDCDTDLGGTWYVKRYPGLAVDIPTTTYSYFFEPPETWSRPSAPEIKQYARTLPRVTFAHTLRAPSRVRAGNAGCNEWRIARRRDAATGIRPSPHRHRKVTHPVEDALFLGVAFARPRAIPVAKQAAIATAPAHPDLGGAEDRSALRRAGQPDVCAHLITQRVLRWFTSSIYEMVSLGAALQLLRGRVPVRARCRAAPTPGTTTSAASALTFSNGYTVLFTKPHVHRRMSARPHRRRGIVGKDGSNNVVDTLVLATGFDLREANFPAVEVIGREAAISESGGATPGSRRTRACRCRTSRTTWKPWRARMLFPRG